MHVAEMAAEKQDLPKRTLNLRNTNPPYFTAWFHSGQDEGS